MSGKRNVSVCSGHELANTLQLLSITKEAGYYSLFALIEFFHELISFSLTCIYLPSNARLPCPEMLPFVKAMEGELDDRTKSGILQIQHANELKNIC